MHEATSISTWIICIALKRLIKRVIIILSAKWYSMNGSPRSNCSGQNHLLCLGIAGIMQDDMDEWTGHVGRRNDMLRNCRAENC